MQNKVLVRKKFLNIEPSTQFIIPLVLIDTLILPMNVMTYVISVGLAGRQAFNTVQNYTNRTLKRKWTDCDGFTE